MLLPFYTFYIYGTGEKDDNDTVATMNIFNSCITIDTKNACFAVLDPDSRWSFSFSAAGSKLYPGCLDKKVSQLVN